MPITGSTIKLRAEIKNAAEEPEDATGEALSLVVVDPTGVESKFTQAEVTHVGLGKYEKLIDTAVSGLWNYRWVVSGEIAEEGTFETESDFDQGEAPDLTDLRVLVPATRRACEGPYGAPIGKAPLSHPTLYAMVADACAEIILFTGSLFSHELEVKERDPLVGFPTAWKTGTKLNEWESAVIVSQAALDYFFHLFRDMKVSESIKNEGTEWSYALSANVIKNYLEALQNKRDKALEGVRLHHPVYDLYASNIRVRDQATVAILEWWDTNSPGLTGSVGIPGGQESYTFPWVGEGPGWP
jgi:hypothetical protein